VIAYFGASYLCMLLVSAALWRAVHAGLILPPAQLHRWLISLCVITLVIALTEVFVPPLLKDPGFKDRLENLIEWYVAGALTLFFSALAWLWRDARYHVTW
jgi:hypothetical protein